MNIFTLVTALIGCITGCMSIAFNIYKILTEQGRLIFQIPYTDNNYFFLKVCKSYLSRYQSAVFVRIINKSTFAATIFDIEAEIEGQLYKPVPFIDDKIQLSNGETFLAERSIELDMTEQITVPHTIQPFGVFQGFLFFPFFPDTSNECLKVSITIKTSRGQKSASSKIYKWNTN